MNKFFQIVFALVLLASAIGCNVQSGYRIHGPNTQMYSYDYSEYPSNKRAHECEGRNFNSECREKTRGHSERRHHEHHHH